MDGELKSILADLTMEIRKNTSETNEMKYLLTDINGKINENSKKIIELEEKNKKLTDELVSQKYHTRVLAREVNRKKLTLKGLEVKDGEELEAVITDFFVNTLKVTMKK